MPRSPASTHPRDPEAPELELGDVLHLSLDEDGRIFSVTVEELEHDLVGVDPEGRRLSLGTELWVRLVIPGDARYRVRARVADAQPELTFVRFEGKWERMQSREFFRIAMEGLELAMVRRDAPPGSRSRTRATLVDISGGGVQVETSVPLAVGERIGLRLVLPGLSPLELDGAVVRSREAGTPRAGVSFVAVPPEVRARLLQWIYALQAQRRSMELDAVHW